MVGTSGQKHRKGKPELRGGASEAWPPPYCSAGRIVLLPMLPQAPRTQLKLPLLSETRWSPVHHPYRPSSPQPLSWRPSSASLQWLMHTAPSTQLCNGRIPAAPSTSAHTRLPPYPASWCLAHRGSSIALVLKQRKDGEIRPDTQTCRGRMNLGFS